MLARQEEIQSFLVDTLRHCIRVEYYSGIMNLKVYDKHERPHDIVGIRNKFDPFVAQRLALIYRKDFVENRAGYMPIITGGVNAHRRQWHHRILKNLDIEEEVYSINLVDAICSMREARVYQNGAHSWEEIRKGFKLPKHPVKGDFLRASANRLIELMSQNIPEPEVNLVTNLREFPELCLCSRVYDNIQERCREALEVFDKEMGLKLF